MSNKKQSIIIISVWLGVVLLLSVFVAPWLMRRQTAAKVTGVQARKQLEEYRSEQENLRKAEESFNFVRSQSIQPENLLPGESTLVSELRILETWADDLSLDLKVKLSGSVAAAKKADTRTSTALVPLILELAGQVDSVTAFLKVLEKSTLPFVADRMSTSVGTSSTAGSIVVTVEGSIYIKR